MRSLLLLVSATILLLAQEPLKLTGKVFESGVVFSENGDRWLNVSPIGIVSLTPKGMPCKTAYERAFLVLYKRPGASLSAMGISYKTGLRVLLHNITLDLDSGPLPIYIPDGECN